MKKFFIAIAAIATALSCSNDDIISIDRQAIGFGNPFVENSVRADYSDGQELTQFNVYGTVTGTAGTVNIFEGVEVKGNVGTAVWSYEEQYNQYWIPGADYNFAAVVDATVAKGDYNMPLTLTTVADATSNLEDMLYATATVDNATATQGAVNFNFSHLLSKVHFTVTSNATGGYHHNVTNITVSNFESGTYTINGDDGTWAGTTAESVAFANIENVTVDNTNGVSNADLLLVPNAATFNVTFTVDLYKGETKLGTETKTVAVDTDLVKGNSYNFTIECSVGNPIQFKVVNDPTWTEQPGVTVQ